jgi:hypothetical protein
MTMVPFARRAGLVAGLLLTVAACRDVEVTAPAADGPDALPPCTTEDCNRFRALTPSQGASLITQADFLASALGGSRTATSIRGQLTTLRTAFARGDEVEARAALLGVLIDIDAAIADPAQRAYAPDLSAIRLNLEPFIFALGLR